MYKSDKELFFDYAAPITMYGCSVAYAYMGYQELKEGNIGATIGCAVGSLLSAGAGTLGAYNFIKERFGNGKLLWD